MQNIIPDEDIELWRKAGRIAATALRYGGKLIKPGASLLEVSDKVEEKIKKMGGGPAFPTQINLDNIAAHYCAEPEDDIVFEDEVICIDVGAHVQGAIGDNAMSVDLSGKHADLVKASREALNNAIKMLAPGVTTGEVGKVVGETIKSYGFTPVRNLSGHGIARYTVHTPPGMPNFDNHSTIKLQKNMIIAIEPFATDGKAGLIHEANECQVWGIQKSKNPRSPYARAVLKLIKEDFDGLPFTTRWVTRAMPKTKAMFGLRELLKEGIISGYPPLLEDSKGLVTQAENTMLITEDGCEVLTVPEDE